MQKDKLQGISLPSFREIPSSASRKAAEQYHYLMETPDGEGMSVQQSELSAFLQRYGTPAGAKKTGN